MATHTLGDMVSLGNGLIMPTIGYGTSHDNGYSSQALIHAVDVAGYRNIDTATRYGSEPAIGKDLRNVQVDRKDIFLTSKIWPGDYGYEKSKQALEQSLKNLDTSYLDLHLMHWPGALGKSCSASELFDIRRSTWLAMEESVKSGKCRAIGVSNFEIRHLKQMLSFCSIRPAVNQIEFHPYCYDRQLVEYCQKEGILVQGYSVLGKGYIFKDPTLLGPVQKVADKYQKSAAQLIIRWCLQHGVAPVAKSLNLKRISENVEVSDFEIADEDMAILDDLSLHRRVKVTWDPKDIP